jgi:cytochrome c5
MTSRRAQRRRECERKLTYGSLEEALSAAREIYRVHGDSLQAYHCRWCHQHHLGHTPHKVKQAMAARRREQG